jgi:bacteriocin leader peptide (microcyclamide/patellamide family)
LTENINLNYSISINKQTEVISMGKKNIQPTTSSPVSRTLVVAPRPTLEELRAEPQEGHISSLTGPDPSNEAIEKTPQERLQDNTAWGPLGDGGPYGQIWYPPVTWFTSYDGDDE